MRVASHTLGFSINRFLPDVIDNITPFVEKVFVALPTRPWSYNPQAREEVVNPTTASSFARVKSPEKLHFVEGDWSTEEEMRNACLQLAIDEGFDWLLTHDADEFYSVEAWQQILTALRNVPDSVNLLATTWYNFWKSAQYIIEYDNGSIKDKNAGFATRCASDVRFIRGRVSSGHPPLVLDTPCYHFGWVLSDEEMLLKIKTWKHTTEFNPERWYRMKWLLWTERSRYLNPTNPTFWTRAVRTPFELPAFAQPFAASLDQQRVPPLREQLPERMHDLSCSLKASLRYWKRSVKGGTLR